MSLIRQSFDSLLIASQLGKMELVSGVLVLPVDRAQTSSREGERIGGSDGDNDGVAIGLRITICGGSGLRGPVPIPCQRQEQPH